jgi:hypothetical protein
VYIGLWLTLHQLEWVKQLSQDPQNFIIAVVREPGTAELLKPLLGPNVVAVKGNISDLNSFSVRSWIPSKILCDFKLIKSW